MSRLFMAARDLYPSEAVRLDKTKVLGFVTMYGSINSHTAVLARTKGIPSVIGLGEALKRDYEGKWSSSTALTEAVHLSQIRRPWRR